MDVSSYDLIEKLRLSLPLSVTLPDPITGAPFQFSRDNVLASLVVDVDNLVLESQTAAAFYGQMARLVGAARKLHKEAEAAYRQWKAVRCNEARANLNAGTDAKGNLKPPTGEQVESYYRTHAEYLTVNQRQDDAEVLVGLFEDLRRAVDLKQRALHDLHQINFGHDRQSNAEERMLQMAEGDEDAPELAAAEAGRAEQGATIAQQKLPHPSLRRPTPAAVVESAPPAAPAAASAKAGKAGKSSKTGKGK